MIKEIKNNNSVYAIIFKKKDDMVITNGLNFLTRPENSFQVGVIAHPKYHVILPHIHYKAEKKIYDRQEMLYIESGKMRISFLTENGNKFEEEILEEGDFVILIDGGHGMEMLEENTRVIYVKQGPYASKELDKKVFKNDSSF